LTTKKSKPASLTSSLLARKGDAEPAAAPYSIPESGRQRDPDAPVSKSKGNGNGNGGDLGHALSGMTRMSAAVHEPKSAGSENGAESEIVKPAAPAHTRPLPLQMQAPATAAQPPAAQPPAAQERAAAPNHAEPLVLGGAMAEEASADGAAIEAAAPAATSAAATPAPAAPQKPAAPAASETVRRAGPGGTGSDDGEAEKEAARDARLLRFVYVMAALTGIVAIILYAGGWLREGPQQRAPEEAVATAPAATETVSPAPAPIPETTSETPGIPPAPPVSAPPASTPSMAPPSVSPPTAADSAPESPVTTGGPAKARPESPAPSMSETASGAGAPPAEPPVAAAPSETPSAKSEAVAPARSETAQSPGATAPSASAKSVAGDDGAGQVSGKPVRDVPNMRVLAPALVKPEPAESAPPPAAVPEPGQVPVLTAPTATQSASVPKTAPQKPAASSANAAGGGFLVQLASVNSEKLAEREWARLQKAFPDLFGSRELTIEKKDIAGRGTFYRVQTGGYASLDEARAVCGDLKAKKQACLPVNR
jgi:hypothetical protein